MGMCRHCGNDAGFLRSAHRECEARYQAGRHNIVSLVARAARGEEDPHSLDMRVLELAGASYVPPGHIRDLVVQGWETALEAFLEDNVLSEKEEQRLASVLQIFQLTQSDTDLHGAHTRMVRAAVLREVLAGNLPSRVKVEGMMPFNLQKGETLVWVFNDVKYFEERTYRERVGGYSGVSIRVMKGVYYRTGGFRGRPVERVATEHVDTGAMGITNKHIYFFGSRKKFRVPYSKIVTFEPFDDGIGIMRDAASAKPQRFVTGDGWFTYNLVVNLARRHDS